MASLIFFIKNTSLRIVDFLIGQTPFFIFILGWFLIITGLLFLTQPEKARHKMLGQGFGFVMGFVKISVIYLALVVFGLGWKFAGAIPKVLSLILIIGLIRLFLAFKKKTFEKFKEKFALVPVSALKIYAWVQVAVGALMIMGQRRIW